MEHEHINGWPQGIKRTRQREDVYEVLLEADRPLNANEIYQRIIKRDNADNYAISTVYRALSVFEEKHIVEKSILMGEDTAVFELNHGGHTHYAICLKCHRLVPLKSCPFEHVAMDTSDDGFSVTGHKLEIYGYCKNCNPGREEEKPKDRGDCGKGDS